MEQLLTFKISTLTNLIRVFHPGHDIRRNEIRNFVKALAKVESFVFEFSNFQANVQTVWEMLLSLWSRRVWRTGL